MRNTEDGSIDLSIEEAYTLYAMGYIFDINDGKVIKMHKEGLN